MVSTGRTDEAIAEAKRAQLLDPVSPETNFTLGSVYFSARQYEQAADNMRRAVELDETFWYSHDFLGRVYEQQGKLPQAIAEFQRALELDNSNPENWSNIGHAWAVADKKREAQSAIDHLNEMSASRYVAPYNYAAIYAGLGEKDKAFEWLEHAYNSRSLYLALLLTTDPHMDGLRSDPRMADLIRRIGL
jgi:tetratricopeptide (TPR) repeat protein